jgi:hypothetical protein
LSHRPEFLAIEKKREAPDVRSAGAGTATGSDTPPEKSEMTSPSAKRAVNNTDGPMLVIGPESRQWRRKLGALAWAALEHLALSARQDEQGWAAPVGVRDVATAIGVTKDTAARAVAALATAGLVTRSRVETHERRRRPGYRLHLPAGIEARPRPGNADTQLQRVDPDRRPSNQDKGMCPADLDSAPDVVVARPGRTRDGADQVSSKGERHSGGATTVAQPALFDPGVIACVEGAP